MQGPEQWRHPTPSLGWPLLGAVWQDRTHRGFSTQTPGQKPFRHPGKEKAPGKCEVSSRRALSQAVSAPASPLDLGSPWGNPWGQEGCGESSPPKKQRPQRPAGIFNAIVPPRAPREPWAPGCGDKRSRWPKWPWLGHRWVTGRMGVPRHSGVMALGIKTPRGGRHGHGHGSSGEGVVAVSPRESLDPVAGIT